MAAPYSPVSHRGCEGGPGMHRAGTRNAAHHAGKPRRNEPRDPCLHHRMLPAHGCSGGSHYPCALVFSNEDGRRREDVGSGLLRDDGCRFTHAANGAIEKSNWMHGTASPPESAARPSRTRPCRDAGSRTMSVAGERYQGYQAAIRTAGGRMAPAASNMRGISTSCAAFRAAQSRLVRDRITRDSCRYRAQYCQ